MAASYVCDGCGFAIQEPKKVGHVLKRDYCAACEPRAQAYRRCRGGIAQAPDRAIQHRSSAPRGEGLRGRIQVTGRAMSDTSADRRSQKFVCSETFARRRKRNARSLRRRPPVEKKAAAEASLNEIRDAISALHALGAKEADRRREIHDRRARFWRAAIKPPVFYGGDTSLQKRS
jgi:hypothetical protein